jgi:hypothetical protein
VEDERRVFLGGVLLDHDIWYDIKFEGSGKSAADQLLNLYKEHGPEPFRLLLAGLRDEFASRVDRCREIDALQGEFRRRTQRRRGAWDPKNGAPYRGLPHLDKRHAPIFFGRDAEVDALIRTVVLAAEQGMRFTVVVGASGSGKSSLVRAGLWARLAAGEVPEFPGSERWLISAMTPLEMDAPAASLRASLLRAIQDQDGFEDKREAAAIADKVPLAELAERLLPPDDTRWLLILDQMEELFAAAVDKQQREAFLNRLLEGLNSGKPSRLQVVATIRSDFSHYCLDGHRALSHAFGRPGGEFKLRAPGRLALEQVVSGPVTEVELGERWSLDRNLAPAMAADAENHPGGLALMAFALRELYDLCKPKRRMDLETYRSESFGGLNGVIARRADKTLATLGEGGGAALERVFVLLVRVNKDEPPTRRRERRAAWDGDAEAGRLVKAFEDARLLVADGEVIEVAHEALLREWPRLAEWVEQQRGAFLLAERVRTEAAAWKERDLVRPWATSVIEEIRAKLAQAGMFERLRKESSKIDRLLAPEAEWILGELQLTGTTHTRRRDIGQRLAEIGDPRPGLGSIDGVPDILWRAIPAGPDSQAFHIAAYPITFGQFRAFLDAKDGDDELPQIEWQRGLPNHPVTHVSWFDATAFCRWLTLRLGFEVRLPDEPEWQWAAQSARPEFTYPWGKEWRDGFANTRESDINRTTAVGMYPAGDSLQGVSDLAGNVWEWCLNEEGESRVLAGGSWLNYLVNASADSRDRDNPDYRNVYVGFRVVSSSPIR